jgi:hypothetical protein
LNSVKKGDYELLKYERGKVELMQGLVVSAELISVEELASRKKQNVEPKKNSRNGADALSVLVNSDEFKKLSGAGKIEALRDFGRKHPGENLTRELLSALDELEQDWKSAQKDAEIAALEQQVKDARLESVRARWREQEARDDAEDLMWSQYHMMYGPLYPVPANGYFSIGRTSPGTHFGRPNRFDAIPPRQPR